MSLLQIILAGVLVLGPLIAIHEFGHYWVARRLGVRVLTFSIGFGPALWKRTGRDGTVYQLAAIPLGGFVRMLDEREGEVDPADRHRAFNTQPVAARMAIVAAGPLINLLLAVLLFLLLALQSDSQLRPVIGSILPGSPAARASLHVGDELLGLDEHPINDWQSANYALIDHLGETVAIRLRVRSIDGGGEHVHELFLNHYLADTASDPFRAVGFVPWTPRLPPVIGQVEPGSAAERSGLAVNDRIVEIDGRDVSQWAEVVEAIAAHPLRPMIWRLERDGRLRTFTVTPDISQELSGAQQGRLGIAVHESPIDVPPRYLRQVRNSLPEAVVEAFDKTRQLMGLTVSSIGKMLIGLIGMDNLSGPITIAKVAGQSAAMGWQAVVGFMALLSVSLGVLNLLPIPVLDGGHLLYYTIEAIWRRPLPEALQAAGLRVGMALMGSVMLLAILNDIRRLF